MTVLGAQPVAPGDEMCGVESLLARQLDLSMRLELLGAQLACMTDELAQATADMHSLQQKTAAILQALEARPAAGSRRV